MLALTFYFKGTLWTSKNNKSRRTISKHKCENAPCPSYKLKLTDLKSCDEFLQHNADHNIKFLTKKQHGFVKEEIFQRNPGETITSFMRTQIAFWSKLTDSAHCFKCSWYLHHIRIQLILFFNLMCLINITKQIYIYITHTLHITLHWSPICQH